MVRWLVLLVFGIGQRNARAVSYQFYREHEFLLNICPMFLFTLVQGQHFCPICSFLGVGKILDFLCTRNFFLPTISVSN